jgi:hypothetical protein
MDEWEAQGHKMSGKVYKEIEYQVKQTVDTLTLSGFMPFYGNIIAAGVKSGKIPYSGRTGRGGVSKYIQALQRYAQARMGIEDEKKSLSVAFAIATVQKKGGMPTQGSYKYTSTGKRTDWVEEAFKKNEDKITEAVRDMSRDVLSVKLDVLIAQWQIALSKD